MPFEEILPGSRTTLGPRTVFSVSVDKHGTVRLVIPNNHPLNQAKTIITLVGTGNELGLLQLKASLPGEEHRGRKMNTAKDKAGKPTYGFLQYSRLSGVPVTKVPATVCQVVELANAVTQLVLPWRNKPNVVSQPKPPQPFSLTGTGAKPVDPFNSPKVVQR